MDSVVNAISGVIDAISDFSRWLYELALYELGYYTIQIAYFRLRLKADLRDLYDEIMDYWLNFGDMLYLQLHVNPVVSAYNNLVSGDFGYFADVFQMSALFSAIISAYLIRFGIRRLPIVG